MAEKRFDANYTFKFNSVPFQNLFSPNQLRIDNWNKIVNQLSAQGNNLSQYLVNLNNWLFGTVTISYSTEGSIGFLQDLDNRIKENLSKININTGDITTLKDDVTELNAKLEEKVFESLPNIIFHIKDLSSPTSSEITTIANIVNSITNNFKQDVNLSAYSDILLSNDNSTSDRPDIRVYSLSSYEHKILDPTYYKFTFNLDDNVEYELIVYVDYTVATRTLEFVKKSDLDKIAGYPIDIDTEDKMNACLVATNVGKIYRYVGTTGTYVNGSLYQVVNGG